MCASAELKLETFYFCFPLGCDSLSGAKNTAVSPVPTLLPTGQANSLDNMWERITDASACCSTSSYGCSPGTGQCTCRYVVPRGTQ